MGAGPRHPSPAAWRALAASIDGDVVRRGAADFPDAYRLFNPRFDTSRPLAVVEAASAHDVSEAIAFARRFGLSCRPKSGGHSYVGVSTVHNGLVIDVGRIRGVRYDAASRQATIGAGARLYPVHRVLAGHGRTIPTGTCPTVGAAGLTLGGGLGVASRAHGLTADSLVGLTMVTADGAIRRVDGHHDPHLLWASRGGGGGSFGVVTSMTYRTQAAAAMGFFRLTFPWAHAAGVLRGWALRMRRAPDSVWANLHLDAATTGAASVSIVGVCGAGDESSQAGAMEAAIGVTPTSVSVFSKPFLDGVQYLGGGTTSSRQGFAAGSDVLRALTPALAHDLVRVVARRAAAGGAAAAILDPLTGAVGRHPVSATAFPWRQQLADVQWYLPMPAHPTLAQVHAAYDWIATAHRAVASESVGGYVNYLEPRRHVRSYYGPNFARLRRIKAAVDPDGFFHSPYAIP